MTFSDLALEVHLILGYKQVIAQLRFKGKEIRFYLFFFFFSFVEYKTECLTTSFFLTSLSEYNCFTMVC